MCTVLLPPDSNPIAVTKYIIVSSNETLILPPYCPMSGGLADFLGNTRHLIFPKRFNIAPLDARLKALPSFLSLHFVARKCRMHLQTCTTGAAL